MPVSTDGFGNGVLLPAWRVGDAIDHEMRRIKARHVEARQIGALTLDIFRAGIGVGPAIHVPVGHRESEGEDVFVAVQLAQIAVGVRAERAALAGEEFHEHRPFRPARSFARIRFAGQGRPGSRQGKEEGHQQSHAV